MLAPARVTEPLRAADPERSIVPGPVSVPPLKLTLPGPTEKVPTSTLIVPELLTASEPVLDVRATEPPDSPLTLMTLLLLTPLTPDENWLNATKFVVRLMTPLARLFNVPPF